MLVSAISRPDNVSYKFSSMPYYGLRVDSEEGTQNSFYPSLKNNIPQEDIPKVLDSVNQWKNFCNRQVVGEKLNVIA